jgi:hypothetical protein
MPIFTYFIIQFKKFKGAYEIPDKYVPKNKTRKIKKEL